MFAIIKQLKRWTASRFVSLRWPLSTLPDRVAATRADSIMNARAASKRFPIRGLRYWWIRCALIEEVQRRNEPVVIADVGCSRGPIKRFIGEVPNTSWVGLDMDIDDAALRKCGYSELHQCDFDKPLPLADHSVDVVVFSHVIEHLPRPDFTVGEISRILRPGGLIIAGSPVAPALIAKLRQWQLRRRLKTGRIKLGRHINSMSPNRWRRLLHEQQIHVEHLAGTFFARWSSNPLENQAWWVRLNQLWGALFPALGGEIYLTARKPLSPTMQRETFATKARNSLALAPKWVWGAAVILVCIGAWRINSWMLSELCPVHELVDRYQDGNDRFYLLTHRAFDDVKLHTSIGVIQHHLDIEARYEEESAKQMDAHFLVSINVIDKIEMSMSRIGLCIMEEVSIDGHRFVLLSSKTCSQQSDAADAAADPQRWHDDIVGQMRRTVCDHYFGEPRQKDSRHRIFKTPWQGNLKVNIQNAKAKAY